MKNVLLFLFCSLLLCSCATTATPASTPSGRPEVFIPSVAPEQVKQRIIERELGKGWQLTQDTAYQISFSKPANTFGAIASFGSQFNGIPDARIRFTLTGNQGGTQVFLNGEMISNPGSAFEKTYPAEDVSPKIFVEMQKVLEEIRAEFTKANQ